MKLRLSEQTWQRNVSVDRDAGVIRGVKILGRVSRNRRTYSEAAMRKAATLYEGVDVNLDHPRREDLNRERSVRDAFGVIENVQFREGDEGGLYGDLRYIRSHAFAPVFAEMAEAMPDKIGLSHNADGSGSRLKDGSVLVESIDKVFSVDVVRTPATNRGLFESQSKESENVKIEAKKLLEAAAKSDAEAKRLLEMVADMPMEGAVEMAEPAPESSAEEQVAVALEAMVVAVLRDSSLDKAGKLAKVRQILSVEEKLMNEGGGGEGESEGEGSSEDEEQKMEEALRPLREEIRGLSKHLQAVSLLESHGLRFGVLPAERQQELLAAKDATAMERLIEAWPPVLRRAAKPSMPIAHPAKADSAKSYDEIKREVFRAQR